MSVPRQRSGGAHTVVWEKVDGCLVERGKQEAGFVGQIQGARQVANCHGAGGLAEERSGIFKRLLIVGGEVCATQLVQAAADILRQTRELAP